VQTAALQVEHVTAGVAAVRDDRARDVPYGGGPAAFPIARDAVRGIDDPVGSLGCPAPNFRERILTNRPFMVTTLKQIFLSW